MSTPRTFSVAHAAACRCPEDDITRAINARLRAENDRLTDERDDLRQLVVFCRLGYVFLIALGCITALTIHGPIGFALTVYGVCWATVVGQRARGANP